MLPVSRNGSAAEGVGECGGGNVKLSDGTLLKKMRLVMKAIVESEDAWTAEEIDAACGILRELNRRKREGT
jgi:hypothetical protein